MASCMSWQFALLESGARVAALRDQIRQRPYPSPSRRLPAVRNVNYVKDVYNIMPRYTGPYSGFRIYP